MAALLVMNRKQRRAAAKRTPGSSATADLWAAGLEHHKAGRLADAERLCRQVLAIDARHADSLNLLGVIAYQVGRHEMAVELISQAIQIRDDVALYHYNLGIALKDQGKLADAVLRYERAFAIKPNFPEALLNLGLILYEQSKLDEAVVRYKQALAIKPNFPEALSNLGHALYDQGNLDEAGACFEQALALKRDYAEARINLGTLLLEQGKVAEATAEAEIACRLDKSPSFPHYSLGVLLARCGLREAAQLQFKRYLEHEPDDRFGARMFLAGLGFEPIPERASDALVNRIYTARAASWDQIVTKTQPYRGAELVAAMLATLRDEQESLDILDAGCGTGLVGILVRPRARCLEGIDLSSAMLQHAVEKGIYDRLYQGDLVKFLGSVSCKYDVITCAATLIHFGDLRPVFEAAATSLRDDGLFIFTLFPNEVNDSEFAVGPFDGLAPGGCYVHGAAYISQLAGNTCFRVAALRRGIHEYYKGKPREAFIIALRRIPRISSAG